MVYEDQIGNERFDRIKKHISEFSFVDLVIWRNEMIACGAVNNRLFKLFSDEISKRGNESKRNMEKNNSK